MVITEDFENCDLGLYRIYWDSGGSSLAAIGNTYSGDRWIAPINWTAKTGENPTGLMSKYAGQIRKMVKKHG